MKKGAAFCAAALIAAPAVIVAQSVPSAGCNAPARDAITHVSVDGNPFTPIPTADGCWIFVTIARPNQKASGGVAVLSRNGGKTSVARKVPLPGSPTGAVLTHDGSVLIVTTGEGVAFLDVARLESGRGSPTLGQFEIGSATETIFANVTQDDSLLFVSAERAQSIVVINLAKTRANGYHTLDVIGSIPVGFAPIALTFSAKGQYLFTTSQVAPPELHWPATCGPEGQDASATPKHPQGAILVVDVARAGIDPAHAVVATVTAGCNPVRLALSPAGDILYATARGENQLLAFDAVRLLADGDHAFIGRVTVGTSPVGVAVIDGGARVVVTNSNRFGQDANDPQQLAVVDAAKFAAGAASVLGTIPGGAFPREMRVTADGRTLLVTNFLSKTVEIVDLGRVQLGPMKR